MIPGRPGVPIIINGVDASYSVVEGDWGLGKGIHVQPTVYGGHFVDPEPNVGHYYPSSGHLPGYGRLEIEPPSNGKPRPAESFHQSWSAESSPLGAAVGPARGAALSAPGDRSAALSAVPACRGNSTIRRRIFASPENFPSKPST